MHEVNVKKIIDSVKQLCMSSNYYLPEDVMRLLVKDYKTEESPIGKKCLEQIIENARIAEKKNMPICQDTGITCVFVELGQDVRISGGNLDDAINEGIRQGYTEGYLRKSVVADPLNRKNTGDNTPGSIHIDIVPGNSLKIFVMPKGGGAENMSKISMLPPSAGVEGVKRFVLNTVKSAGPNPCPPIIVGVGIGGTFDSVGILAKKSLLRSLDSPNPDIYYAKLERELLEEINDLGIGPQGLGGRITALAVLIRKHPCHITSIPVAVNIQCHAARHKEIVL